MSVIKTEIVNNIHVITMDRPDALNAFNADMMDELCSAFLAAADNDEIKVVVLTGAGRAFSAGADLKSGSVASATGGHNLEDLLFSIIDLPKPFIVAANGLGVGIGCTILGLADMAYISEEARFRCPFSALGLTAEASSTYTFTRLMGHQRASWILLSSEWITSNECVEAGLALESFPADVFMNEVMKRANTLSALPISSLRQTKELIVGPQRAAMKAAVIAENKGLAELRGSPANLEALKAFMEKREPQT
ncbi:MAG: enoyl-CoA hydratase-related protein [Pseudomonadales bacterium]|jgi:enoyl-CoA hydratase/carnithine racemase